MAPMTKKRVNRSNEGHVSKRQKINPDAARSETVSLDQLQWKDVPFPERFDDAEGFLGLEEISDVEVSRDEKVGRVAYKIASKKVDKPAIGNKSAVTKGDRLPVATPSIQDDSEDDWEGFAESPQETQKLMNNIDPISTRKKKSKIPPRVSEDGRQNRSAEGARQGQFESLRDLEEYDGDVSKWEELNLSEETMAALARMNFWRPTPVQRAAIPEIRNGHDVIGKASTGSGKTLAFGIPIFEFHLQNNRSRANTNRASVKDESRSPIALIISPTRELAHQLSDHLSDLCGMADGPAIATLTGGLSVHKQQRLLTRADIIIGTPGRIWELMSGDAELSKKLQTIEFLVLDEADRLLSEGHFKELTEILNALDRSIGDGGAEGVDESESRSRTRRQNLVFSATFQKDLQQKLAGRSKQSGNELMSQSESMEYLLKKIDFREEKPKFIDINPISQMAENLTEGIVECAGLEKDTYLYTLLLHHSRTRILVFVNSISSVRRLAPFLQNLNLQAHALHSQMPQKARLRAIERFSSSASPSSILVATDVAARGLDIPSVQLVLHYHVPRAADAYVHRSGRTARAGNSGSSILLCAPEEVQGVRRLVAKVHARTAGSANEDLKKHFIRTIELDRRIVSRVKDRVALSKKITDASLAKEKYGHEDNWLKTAAEDLGVEYDSDEFAAAQGTQKGRGQGRKYKEKQARGLSRDELASSRARLREELKKRINVGVSERYLTAGGVDVDALLAEKEQGQFLGRVDLDEFGT